MPTSRWSAWPSSAHSARLVSTIRPSRLVTAMATGESWKVRRKRSVAAERAASAWSRSSSASARPNMAKKVMATNTCRTVAASRPSTMLVNGPVARAAAQSAAATITMPDHATPRGPKRSAAHTSSNVAENARVSFQ